MQVNPEDGPQEIYVTWSDPRMTDFVYTKFQLKMSICNGDNERKLKF